MKRIFITILLFALFVNIGNSQVLKGIKVYYFDNQTIKGKRTYKELTKIGENPWSKPDKLDIILYFNKHTYSEGDRIEILIEELYEPTNFLKKAQFELEDKRWVPHQIVFSDVCNAIKSNQIIIKSFPYQTAYFMDSILFTKDAFRIVGVFYDDKSKKVEKVMKTFYFE